MKMPLLPAHILTTKGLAAKIKSARAEVEDSHKEDRQKDNRALSKLLHRNHQLGLKVFELTSNIERRRKTVNEKSRE